MMSSYHGVLFNRICEEIQQNMAIGLKWPEGGNKIPWREDVELLLHFAMIDLKPVGVNRNFMMLFIHDRFTSYVDKEVYSKPIWDHLDSMYDMAALHESETLPFPSEEVDFELPPEFDDLVMEKFGVSLPHTETEDSQSKSNTPLKSVRKMSASKLKPITPTLGKNKEPFTPKQSTSSALIIHKSGKSTPNSKSDEKPVIAESSGSSSKTKKELSMPAKITKTKRSSSPFSTKSSKSETRESSPDIPVRKSKPERSSSPAITKKPPIKTESPSTPISVKKGVTKELVKHIKSDSSDSPMRKIKNERDSVGKKGKLPSSEMPGSKKGGKIDSNNGARKMKSDSDNSAKKNVDSTSNRQLKVDVKNIQGAHSKGLKPDDVDALLSSGSRKSSPIVKLESVDSLKKRKRQKVEESPKKNAPPTKRRR